MAVITDADRVAEFKNLLDFLIIIDAPAKIMTRDGTSYLLVALPTNEEMWEPTDTSEDPHFATLRLEQPLNPKSGATKSMILESRIKLDVGALHAEPRFLAALNELNGSLKLGAVFCAKRDADWGLTYRIVLSGTAGEFLSEAAVCESIVEMGRAYDMIKTRVGLLLPQAATQ